MKLRYATWQAVSTKAQAKEDKVSIKVQLEKCLEAGRVRGWVHVKDYTVPGQSRTQWTSLYHAEKHIPELHSMLEAAARGAFDVLVVYDLNRFRDLMRQVFDALCDSNVQLYIIADPREPVPPSQYTEERKGEISLTVGLRDIISRSEISNLQKHYRDKMPHHGWRPGFSTVQPSWPALHNQPRSCYKKCIPRAVMLAQHEGCQARISAMPQTGNPYPPTVAGFFCEPAERESEMKKTASRKSPDLAGRVPTPDRTAQAMGLPVAPEFVDSLHELAFGTAKTALEALHVPQEVISLVGNMYDLSYYSTEIYRDPGQFKKDRSQRFDAEGVVLETINAIAACGGTFPGVQTKSMPRVGTVLASRGGENG